MTRRFHPGRSRPDQGIALVAVLGTMFVLTLFLSASLAYALQTSSAARRDEDAKTAMAAAQAGLEDYLARLNADTNYWTTTTDPANPALTTTGPGRTIQGAGGQPATYRYQLVTTPAQTAQSGVVGLRVTGTSAPGPGRPAISRTLTATLQPKGFLNFVYVSDVEVGDPALNNSPAGCAAHYYDSPSRSGLGCDEIMWIADDTVNGPLHSNDALQINGAVRFLSPTTESSWPAIQDASSTDQTWWGAATYPLGGYSPHYAPPLELPTANTELLKQVEPDVDGDGQVGPGCYYTGSTRIIFQGTTMRVLSPSTTAPDTPVRCLDVANSSQEQVKPIPAVIYVAPTASSCTQGALGYPRTGEYVTTGASSASHWTTATSATGNTGSTTNYDCQRGSVYIQGTADTQVTVSAEDDVVVTGDLLLADQGSGADVIGLIAGNYVWVYHPVDAVGNNLDATDVGTIQAAILSLRHSFVVQNNDEGSLLGSLTVLGSIAQKFRGRVGTLQHGSLTNGYTKNYIYDHRLAYLQPPYFLKPTSSPWQIRTISDN
jgi:hypothetical protein